MKQDRVDSRVGTVLVKKHKRPLMEVFRIASNAKGPEYIVKQCKSYHHFFTLPSLFSLFHFAGKMMAK